MNHEQKQEFERLFDALENETGTSADENRLLELVAQDVTLRQEYIERMFLVGQLRRIQARPPQQDQLVAPSAATPVLSGVLTSLVRYVNRPTVFSLISSVALILAVLTLMAMTRITPQAPKDTARTAAPRVFVARVTGTLDCRWSEGDTPVDYGSHLFAHQSLRLERGLIEITFKSGAQVMLTGPCEFVARDTGDGFLSAGSLTADVPPQAIGFTVATPSAVIVDHGTEFGVAVDADGNTEVHVFSGEVEAVSSKESGTPLRLTVRQAARFTRASEVASTFGSNPENFVRRVVGSERTDFATLAAHRRWQEHQAQVRRHPRLIAYYAFDNQAAAPGRLENLADATAPRLAGRVGDEANSLTMPVPVGGVPPFCGLKFDGLDDRVLIPADAALQPASFTVEAWAKVTGGEATWRSLVTLRSFPPCHGYALYAGGDNRWEFWTGSGTGLWDTQVGAPVELQKWTHVAGTYDAATRSKRLYVNGQLAAESSDIGYAPHTGENPLVIGAGGDVGQEFFFPGVINELAIYAAALPADEIAAHYQSRLLP